MAKTKRRAYGSGSVTRAGSRWCARMRLGGRVVSRAFATRAEADTWCRTMRPAKASADLYGLPAEGSRPLVTYQDAREPLAQALAAGLRRKLTTDTLRGYKSALGRLVAYWGPRRIKDTRPADVDAWVAAMRQAGLASSTIRARLDLLSLLHQLAVREGWLLDLPCKITRPRVILKSEPQAISEADLARLLEAAAASEDWQRLTPMVLLAADAGLRRAEIARLHGQHVRTQAHDGACWGWLHVAVESEDERTKSGKGRDVPILTERLRLALDACFPRPGARLLPGFEDGNAVGKASDWLWTRAGLGDYGQLHSCRHRFITRLLEEGEAPVKVQQWAGHADLSTTMRYCHAALDPTPGVGESLAGQKCAMNVQCKPGKVVPIRRRGTAKVKG